MDAKVKQAALELVERATAAGLTGSVADSVELQRVNQDLGGEDEKKDPNFSVGINPRTGIVESIMNP